MSCPSATDCFAVGYHEGDSNVAKTLIEQWNGQTWTRLKPPSPGTASQLNAIACTSTSNCKAVGYTGDTALAERWNGQTWAVQPAPVGGSPTLAALNGISCVTAANCTAVGDDGPYGATSSLAEHWNGAAWSQQDTPVSTGNDSLWGVTCRPGGFCLATGEDDEVAGNPSPIAETRNS